MFHFWKDWVTGLLKYGNHRISIVGIVRNLVFRPIYVEDHAKLLHRLVTLGLRTPKVCAQSVLMGAQMGLW